MHQTRVPAQAQELTLEQSLDEYVKGAMLIGNGPDALTRVKMVGNDMALDPGIGTGTSH